MELYETHVAAEEVDHFGTRSTTEEELAANYNQPMSDPPRQVLAALGRGEALGLAETAGTTDLTGYLFLGMLALNLGSAGFWAVAYSLKMELDAGTLEPGWLTPTRRETFVIGMTLAGLVFALLATAILLAIGIWFFGAQLAPRLVVAIPALAVASIGVLGIGYLIGAIVLARQD